MLDIWFCSYIILELTTFTIAEKTYFQYFSIRLVLFTYCYDKDRQSSHNAAICRIWRHSLFYAKFINLSYIKNLVWHFLTLFLFLPVSQGCYFQIVFYVLTSLFLFNRTYATPTFEWTAFHFVTSRAARAATERSICEGKYQERSICEGKYQEKYRFAGYQLDCLCPSCCAWIVPITTD